jgi:hypothetical protein
LNGALFQAGFPYLVVAQYQGICNFLGVEGNLMQEHHIQIQNASVEAKE